MVCHSHANKTYFDKKDCSDSTWPHLEVKVFVTSRKWPDRTVAYFIALRLRLHFQISRGYWLLKNSEPLLVYKRSVDSRLVKKAIKMIKIKMFPKMKTFFVYTDKSKERAYFT